MNYYVISGVLFKSYSSSYSLRLHASLVIQENRIVKNRYMEKPIEILNRIKNEKVPYLFEIEDILFTVLERIEYDSPIRGKNIKEFCFKIKEMRLTEI